MQENCQICIYSLTLIYTPVMHENNASNKDKDNLKVVWHLRHWLQFWQLNTSIHYNLCDLTIKSDTGQHLQFLQWFRLSCNKTFITTDLKTWHVTWNIDIISANLVPQRLCPPRRWRCETLEAEGSRRLWRHASPKVFGDQSSLNPDLC